MNFNQKTCDITIKKLINDSYDTSKGKNKRKAKKKKRKNIFLENE